MEKGQIKIEKSVVLGDSISIDQPSTIGEFIEKLQELEKMGYTKVIGLGEGYNTKGRTSSSYMIVRVKK